MYLLFILTIFLLLFLLSMVWPPDSPWSPWWRTSGKVARAIVDLAQITKKDVIYDLGCGDGTALITAAKLKEAHGVGIEIDPSRFLIAKLRVLGHGLSPKITIKRRDLFKEDISEATVIIVYLIPKALNQLEAKFKKELRPGTRIVSYIYPINYLPQKASSSKHQLMLYEIPFSSKTNSGKKRQS